MWVCDLAAANVDFNYFSRNYLTSPHYRSGGRRQGSCAVFLGDPFNIAKYIFFSIETFSFFENGNVRPLFSNG